MVTPTEGQPVRDHAAYQKWNEKDHSACYTLLSSLQNDLIGQYNELPTCKALWDQLKFSFGGTSTTRLRSIVIKFEEYTKNPKHTMSEHLRVMSNMIGKLRDAGHALTDEQQHVILEAETQDADKALIYVAQEGSRNANGKRGRQSKKGKKNEASTSAPKEGNMKKRKRGKRGGKRIRLKLNASTVNRNDTSLVIALSRRSIGDASKNLDLYELEEVEANLPSPSEGGELVLHSVVAEDIISDPQPSGSIPDSGSTPPGPSGQQDSQLRRGARGRVPRRRFEIDGEILMCTSNDEDEPTSVEEALSSSTTGNNMSSSVATKQWLSSTFKMKDMGEADYVLGVKIIRDRPNRLLAALDFVKDPKYHGKAKHIGLRYHFIRTLVAQGEVTMNHIPTSRMVADPLTKPIARDVFLSHIRSMGLRRF
ncbi:hypothetical protein RJ640_016768 [Escallonia rubra]|uniref:Polyprotein n=1 Tax=Escallonia rubra TaxID=112253 RepID=A0AA88UGF4_9ASTE|nr:hypothetical protein RJ640_016768 [Escallonia rubra]